MNPFEPWRTLVTVVDEKSVSKAALKLRISQPAVSQQLKQLESLYRTPLFIRGHRGLSLTEAGRTLYEEALQIIIHIDRSFELVENCSNRLAGTLAIGASMTIAEYVVPSALRRFRSVRPQVKVKLTTGNTDDIGRGITDGDLLLGLVEAPLYDTRLIQEPFLTDELGVVIPTWHSLRTRTSVALTELQNDRLLIRESGSGTRSVFEAALKMEGLDLRNFSIFLETNNPQTLKSLVESGYGISIMSKWAVRKELNMDQLAFVPIESKAAARNFSIVWHQSHSDDQLVQAFCEELRQLNHAELG
ncbi:MAG: LysR family transcriptional regulator [Acidibacillus sp.]|nr:LysR family transcriptional regulator [Acidibacillus sp.]